MMKLPHTGHIALLALSLSGVLLSLSYAIVSDPAVEMPSAFEFPAKVPLSDWQFDNSHPVSVSASPRRIEASVVSSRDYYYRQNNLPLTIKMRYVTNAADTNDNKLLMQTFVHLPAATIRSLTTRWQSQIGFYQLSTDPKTAYLGSCINPQGNSTVTREQFLFNRNTADLQPQRIFLWLQGRAPLQDNRCLWVLMSVPLQASGSDAAYSTLETVWFVWYPWWKARFPPA